MASHLNPPISITAQFAYRNLTSCALNASKRRRTTTNISITLIDLGCRQVVDPDTSAVSNREDVNLVIHTSSHISRPFSLMLHTSYKMISLECYIHSHNSFKTWFSFFYPKHYEFISTSPLLVIQIINTLIESLGYHSFVYLICPKGLRSILD